MIQPICVITTNTTQQKPQAPQFPNSQRNYTLFEWDRVNSIAAQKERALPYVKQVLATSQDEKQIVESLYIVDRMLENKTKGIPAMYPILARFNNTQSPNIQAFLAGIYRKTQVPDAFGPLVSMLIKNSTQAATRPAAQQPFDPNEEIGGAILAYISNYSKGTPQIDYSA